MRAEARKRNIQRLIVLGFAVIVCSRHGFPSEVKERRSASLREIAAFQCTPCKASRPSGDNEVYLHFVHRPSESCGVSPAV